MDLEKILPWFVSESVQPMFSSKSFLISGLIFRSLIHFELFLCVVLGSVRFIFSGRFGLFYLFRAYGGSQARD